jgi:hypothetical protein
LKKFLTVILVNLGAVLIIFAAAEIIYRRYLISHTVFESVRDVEFDEWLGWVPKPGIYGRHVITPDRFRKNQPPNLSPEGKKVLIGGDSFTYGCGVLDEETWPYYLAEATGWRVTNAGVSGYGLDQIVLRLEKVIPRIRPELVIISVIPNDIARCELSKRTRYKPYFTIVDGRPVLRHQPVPSPYELPGPRRWYEKSLILRHLSGVLKGGAREVPDIIREHDQGMAVARYLCARAADIARRNNAGFLMVIQPAHAFPGEEELRVIQELEPAIRSSGIPVLNLLPLLEEDFRGRAVDREALFAEHMTASGNKWVAKKVEEFICRIKDSEQ